MGLGMPEVILILVVALIIFGPRKLPELGKSLGQAMSQFKRASDDFKRTWEQEVEMDKYRGTSNYSSSSSEHSASTDYNSTYNPYSGEYESSDSSAAYSSTAQLTDGHTGVSTEVTEPAKAEATAAATAEPKQQHWI